MTSDEWQSTREQPVIDSTCCWTENYYHLWKKEKSFQFSCFWQEYWINWKPYKNNNYNRQAGSVCSFYLLKTKAIWMRSQKVLQAPSLNKRGPFRGPEFQLDSLLSFERLMLWPTSKPVAPINAICQLNWGLQALSRALSRAPRP